MLRLDQVRALRKQAKAAAPKPEFQDQLHPDLINV